MAGTPFLAFGLAGDSGAASRMEAFNATLRMVGWADKTGLLMEHELKAQAPTDKRGRAGAGRLKNSIHYQRRTSIGKIVLTFHSDDPAARWVIDGTRPHPITPNGTGHLALHFPDASGEMIFRNHVQHRGSHANPFHEKALERMLPVINSSFAALFERI